MVQAGTSTLRVGWTIALVLLYLLFFVSPVVVVLTLQIATQIREFVESEENELVLPGKLSAGERNAVHSLAAGEGLGYETRGDEGNRALHVWKVRKRPASASLSRCEVILKCELSGRIRRIFKRREVMWSTGCHCELVTGCCENAV